jgi:hypothetical protein
MLQRSQSNKWLDSTMEVTAVQEGTGRWEAFSDGIFAIAATGALSGGYTESIILTLATAPRNSLQPEIRRGLNLRTPP